MSVNDNGVITHSDDVRFEKSTIGELATSYRSEVHRTDHDPIVSHSLVLPYPGNEAGPFYGADHTSTVVVRIRTYPHIINAGAVNREFIPVQCTKQKYLNY